MINPLSENPGLRKKIYTVFWALGLLLGAIQVAFATASDADQPRLQAAFAVYAFLGGAVGFTAASHVPENGEDVDELAIDGLEDLPDDDEDVL